MTITHIEVLETGKCLLLEVGALAQITRETNCYYFATWKGVEFKINKKTGYCPSTSYTWYAHNERPLFNV